EVEVPASGTYTFHTQSDDGIRLWVNGQRLIDNWTNHGNTPDSNDITLAAGQRYRIRLEYYEDGGGAVCELYWSSLTIQRQIIPSRYLSVERPLPRNPEPADGAIVRDIWTTLSWAPGDYAASHNVYLGEDPDEVRAGTGDTFRGNQTETSFAVGFPGFPYPEGIVAGTTYYWRIEDVEADGVTIHTGPLWKFSVAPRSAYDPDPADGAGSVDPNVTLSWEPGFGAILHYLYFGDDFDQVNSATGGLPQGATTYSPGTLEPEKFYYWRLDAFHGFETLKGEVWSFSTPGAVGNPKPPQGAVNVKHNQILKWTAGDNAASHELYFGMDADAVRSATKASPEYKGSKDLGVEGHDPGMLEWNTDYYWRVDEINTGNANSPWKGGVWRFITADFLVVDDFEDYNDFPPDEVWNTWIDGFGTATNGATAGYPDPDWAAGEHFVETRTVHGGEQSLPYLYDTDMKFSEATMTLVYPRDWTEKGVDTLALWFKGDWINVAAPMYVALNGTVSVYHDDPEATRKTAWTEWKIPLQAFADQGVDLTNVNTISIGFGDKANLQPGGLGQVFIDDIGLHRLTDVAGE
ncbi:MAG: PA14 domain-containing protein, partial [Planctomycetota bacterium]